MKQQVGAQLYTLRDVLKTEEEFIVGMKKLREIGFEYVQFSGVTAPLSPQRVREILDEQELKIACSHMPWERLVKEPEKVAEENLVMGCPIVGLSWCSEHKLEDLEDVRTYIGQVQKIGRVMRENGLTFAIHNHWMEFHRYDGKTVFQMLKEHVDPDHLSFILCCYWAIEAGADPVEYLHEFAGRVPVCHYKDRTMLKSERTFAPVGQGNMNYKAIFKACEETGVQHAMIEQDICRKDPFECMAESRAHILSLGEAYDKGAL